MRTLLDHADALNEFVDELYKDESREIIVFLHQGYDEYNFISKNFLWLKEVNKNETVFTK